MPDTSSDQTAAHSLWVELATRITTQRLHYRSGDEETAARSIHSLFGKTRELMDKSPEAVKFLELAERMLNETIRPFTARWHGWMVPDPNLKDKDGQPVPKFRDPQVRRLFRAELRELQPLLLGYLNSFEALKDGKKVNAKWTRPDVKMLDSLREGCGEQKTVNLDAPLPAGIGCQIKIKSGFRGALSIDEINALEKEAILERRQQLTGTDPGAELNDVSGLAFSGGGIRSATFCLGIAQVLQRRKLLPQFDYLSTVSGGGYIGSFLSCYLGTGGSVKGEKPEDLPEERLQKRFAEAFQAGSSPESTAIRHLRNNSCYLLGGGAWGRLSIMGLLISGVIFNIMLVLPLALLGALGVKALESYGYFGGAVWLVNKPKQMLTGLDHMSDLLGGLTSGLSWVDGLSEKGKEVGQSVVSSVEAAWFPGWHTPAMSVLLVSCSILLLLLVLLPVFQNVSHGDPPASTDKTWRLTWEAAALFMFVVTLLALGLWLTPALFRFYGMTREGLDVMTHFKQLQGRLDTVLALVGLGFSSVIGYISVKLKESGWLKKFTSLLFLLSGPALLCWVFLSVGWRLMVKIPEPTWEWQTVALVTAGLAAWGWLGVNVNTYSPHGYYRNRLCECYLATRDRNEAGWFLRVLAGWWAAFWSGEATAARKAAPVQKNVFGTLQQLPLSQVGVNSIAPYHLINTTVNLTSSESRELRGRNGDFFLLSPKVCGSPVCGYVRTENLEKLDAHVDLGTAMAVSGAAASSNMGVKTIPSLRTLMTLTNVRLGYWLPNPALEPVPAWLHGPGPKYLFKEMTGAMNEHDRYLNLSDGGHIENLAVYELLRRRAKFIVCADAGQEAGMECSDLVRLQRYAEIDLGIRMHFDRHDLSLMPDGNCRAYGLLVKIYYPADPQQPGESPPTGWMLYLKLAMTGTERAYVLDYRRENPLFPHETTGDQFFDEAQFEAYRHLGECAMESFFRDELLDGQETHTMKQWFEFLCAHLLPDNDETLLKSGGKGEKTSREE